MKSQSEYYFLVRPIATARMLGIALCLIFGTMLVRASSGDGVGTRSQNTAKMYALAEWRGHRTTSGAQEHTQIIYLKTKQRIKAGSSAFLALRRVAGRFGISTFRTLSGNLFAMTIPIGTSIEAMCREFEQMTNLVEYAEPAQTLHVRQTAVSVPLPNDPLAPQQYHIERVRLREAWNVAWNQASATRQADSSMVIAVCDTGVDWEHEDLAANIWTNTGESGRDAQGRDKRTNGVDDDRNGKIDDWHGWDFVGSISEDEREAGVFREDNDPKPRFNGILDPTDRLNHGTHVASTLAALMGNGKGGVGVAPRCHILPIKCSTDGTRVGGISRGYEAMLYAAQMGAKVIVCSFGGGQFSRFEQDVVNTATALGALVVVAAGNDGKVSDDADYPASYDNVLCVGASNQADRASSFSDFGIKVHVFAPGEQIMSAIIGNKYSNEWSGCSMSAPIVAGIAALTRLANPTWTPRQIVQQLRATSDNVLTSQVSTRPLGYFGRVNALNALTTRPPGLTLTKTSISAAGGVVHDVQPVTIALQCSNILAAAQNVRLTLLSLDGVASIFNETETLGNLANSASRQAKFQIQLDPVAVNGSGTRVAQFVVILRADAYVNYERVSVLYDIRAPQGVQMLTSSLVNIGETAVPKKSNIELRNFGTESLTLGAVRLSGANANDFTVQLPNSTTLAAGASMLVPVQFAPVQGFAGARSATLTLSAATQGATTLAGVQGAYDATTAQGVYTEFSDGTTLRPSPTVLVDDVQLEMPLGFSFAMNGNSYERVTISSNGFCAFAPTSSLVQLGSPVVSPLRTFVRANAYIAAFGTDLIMAQANADVRAKTEGISPNRVFVVQWRNLNTKTPDNRADSSVRVSVQARFYEASNRIEIVFGWCGAEHFAQADVGLRGASAQDFHTRRVSDDIPTSWAASVEAVSNEEQCEFTYTNLPSPGLTFRWTPRTTPRQRSAQTLTRTTELRASVPMIASSVEKAEETVRNSLECSISPNPARDEAILRFRVDAPTSVQIAVVNSLGAKVWETRQNAPSGVQSVLLPVSDLPNGLYFVTLSTAHQTLQQRLLVVR
jgi:subtilisin family serine protease